MTNYGTYVADRYMIEPYGYPVNILICDDVTRDTRDYYKSHDIDAKIKEHDRNGLYLIRFNNEDQLMMSISIKRNLELAKLVSIIAHEAHHCIMYTLYDKGLKWCNKSDEAFAYSIEKLVLFIMNLYLAHPIEQKPLEVEAGC